VCKKLIKNFQPFEKNCQKTAGGDLLTHTVCPPKVSAGYVQCAHVT